MNATFDTIIAIVGCLGYGAACIAGALLIDRINQRDIRIARVAARYRIEREDRESIAKELEEQRRSFAYGNVHLHNPSVTRGMIDAAAEELDAESGIRCVDDEPITQRQVAR